MATAYDMKTLLMQVIDYTQRHFSDDFFTFRECSAEEPPPKASWLKRDAVAPMALHRNTRYELCVMASGAHHLQLGSEIRLLRTGEAVLIAPGVYHGEYAESGERGVCIWFTFRPFGVTANASGVLDDGKFHILTHERAQVDSLSPVDLVERICAEQTEKKSLHIELVKVLYLQLLIDSLRAIHEPTHREFTEKWRRSVADEVIRYIDGNGGRAVELSELVSHLAISKNYLNVIFREMTGKTIIQYSAELRTRLAKELLKEDRLRLREIAEQLGYYDQYHFCKVFKKATGVSPSEYRASHRVIE